MRVLRMGLLSLLTVFLGMTSSLGQPKFPGVFVVPIDYKEISAAVEAAYKAGGGTVIVFDRAEGAYGGFAVGGDERENAGKFIRILGVGAVVDGSINILCRMRVEIIGLTINGNVDACASAWPVGGAPPPQEGPAGALTLRSNTIYGTVRVWTVIAVGYELELTDNTISGGPKGGVFIDLPFGIGAIDFRYLLRNNRIFSSQGDGLRLVLTSKTSATLEGNEIWGNRGHGLVLEFQGDQPAPVELVGNVISGNGACAIHVNDNALRIGVQLRGQANPIWDPLCPDPSSSEQAAKLFPSGLRSGEVRRVCPQGCPFRQLQEALKNSQRGDVIVVEPGLYAEQLRISGSRIIRLGQPATAAAGRAVAQTGRVVLSAEGLEGPGIVVERGATLMLEGVTIQGFRNRCLEKWRDRCVDIDGGDGMRVRSGARVLLRDVEFVNNEDDGLEVEPGAIVHLQRVRLGQNGFGLFLLQGSQAQLDQAQIERNRSTGLLLREQSQLVLRRSHVVDNGGRGLTLAGGARLHLEESRIEGNGGCGLQVVRAPVGRITGTSLFAGNYAADLCGPVPKEIRLPLAEPKQTSVEFRCPQADPTSLQAAIDSLQPGGRLRLQGRCSTLATAVIDKPIIIEGSNPEQAVLQGFVSVLSGGQLQLQGVRAQGTILISGTDAGNKLQAQRSALDFVVAEAGEITLEESRLMDVSLRGIFAPVKARLRNNQIQGDLEFLALLQPVEAEVIQNRLTGGIVGVWTVGVPPVIAKVRLQSNEISDYLTGVLLEGLSEVILEGNTIKDNWLGVGINTPDCPSLTELFFSGKLEGRGNNISGNVKDFCPPHLGLRLR
jgi:nitrous oxidase accessory protein NosD